MTNRRLITTYGLIALLAVPSFASAQSRGQGDNRHTVRRGEGSPDNRARAVPRGSVRVVRPPVVRGAPYYRGYGPAYYRGYGPAFGFGFYSGYYGRPFGYGYPAYGFGVYGYPGNGYSGYGYPGYGYGFGYPGYGHPGYGHPGYAVAVRPYGGVRIDLPARDAEVFVDGYFVGVVDEFDGAFQQVNLEAGPHKIEVRAAGFETIVFDVNIEPGRTITYRAGMRPQLP